MSRLAKILLLVTILVLGAGAVFLATWDIPPPSKTVEKVLDDARFPR